MDENHLTEKYFGTLLGHAYMMCKTISSQSLLLLWTQRIKIVGLGFYSTLDEILNMERRVVIISDR